MPRAWISLVDRRTAAIAALALAAAAQPVRAASAPDALRVGGWFVSPYVESAYSADNNVFRQSEDVGTSTDRITTLSGGLLAELPLRRSVFRLGADMTQVTYDSHEFTRDTDISFAGQAEFEIAKYDVLRLSESYTEGFTDVARLENSELIFDGKPYDRNRFDLELSRGVARRAGYSARVSWTDLAFVETSDAQQVFYDYRGYDMGLEYRHPLPSYKWLVAYYGQHGYDHFDNAPAATAAPEDEDCDPRSHACVPGAAAVDDGGPFRTELGRTAQLGVRGRTAKDKAYLLRIGWGQFRYDYADPAVESSAFTGITVSGRIGFAIGGGTTVDVALERGAKPSAYDTHFVNTMVVADFARDWRNASDFGLRLRYDKNTYGDPIDTGSIASGGCGMLVRDDDRYEVEGYVDWMLHRRFGYTMSASWEIRGSNCPVFEYHATVLSIGIRAGWF